jgi:diaminohydroxyphosphoribosylaminopyrimidine deaminase/5-amino-6-(5-phosphoribosylamino)uracil reductase
MSADGRISPAAGRGGRISGDRAQAFVHDLRAHVDAVAVGAETARIDDPRLTCRLEGGLPHGRPQPIRVVFDDALQLSAESRLLDDAPGVPCLVLTAVDDPARHASLTAKGAEVLLVPPGEGGLDLAPALAELYARGVRRLLVEGGARLHGSFLRAGLADQVSAFVAPLVLGGESAPPAVTGTGVDAVDRAFRLTETRWRKLGDDLLLEGYVAPATG